MSRTGVCTAATILVVGLLLSPGLLWADACLMAYSTGPCVYHYSSSDFYTVSAGDPLYDPAYDRNGEVLIKFGLDEIALDVYQAPGLTGFVHDEVNQGYFSIGTDYDLVIDGFSNEPTTYYNILLVFDSFEPASCVPTITIDGNPPLYDAGLGYYYPIGDLVVQTPTPLGNNYSDTVMFTIHWDLCSGLRVWAFADEDYNLVHNPSVECFTAFSHDLTVPVKEETWSAIKGMFSRGE